MGTSCTCHDHPCTVTVSRKSIVGRRMSWVSVVGYGSADDMSPPPAARRKRTSTTFCNEYKFDGESSQRIEGVSSQRRHSPREGGDEDDDEASKLHQRKVQEQMERACRAGDFRAAVEALSKGADIDQVNLKGQTCMMLAASSHNQGTPELLKLLVDAQAGLTAKDSNGWTALHHAARNGRKDNCQFLLEHGASVSATTLDGKTTATLACLEGDATLVLHLLDAKAKMDKKDIFGWPLLLYACEGKLPLVKDLVFRKANLKVKSKDNDTPLHVASNCGNLPVCKFLLARSASVNAVDKNGDSPLMAVLKNDGHINREEMSKFLLHEGTDITIQDQLGSDAHDIAQEHGVFVIRNTIDKIKAKLLQAETYDMKTAIGEKQKQRRESEEDEDS